MGVAEQGVQGRNHIHSPLPSSHKASLQRVPPWMCIPCRNKEGCTLCQRLRGVLLLARLSLPREGLEVSACSQLSASFFLHKMENFKTTFSSEVP